jgi:DNA-binding transcriptional LysR family regulator/predicted ATPase
MELEARLRAFAAVAREGSFSRAAETLYVSQPAVSKQVAALETEVGKQLLVRDRRGVTLTATGRVLADYVLRAEALLANARRALGAGEDAQVGTLAVAASGIPGTYLLPAVVARFRRLHAGVEIDFRVTTSAGALELVRAHEVELAVVGGLTVPPELETEQLVEDEIVLVGPPSLGGRRLRPKDLEAQTWVTREEGSATRAAVEAARWGMGLHAVPTLELPSWEAVKLTVAAGAGVAPISRLALDLEVAAGTLAVLDVPRWRLRRTVSIVRARDVPLTPPAERFLALLRERFQPEQELLPPNSNLPAEPTPLVGRERELTEVSELLRSTRLVTLSGAGGSGKTRLALAVAASLVDSFRDGVYLVELAALQRPELVEQSIAAALGGTDATALDELLAGRGLLLVLDNFEHLLGAARLVSRLLARTDQLHVLVTSRTRLRLRSETEYRVGPLAAQEAVELFLERALATDPRFEADPAVEEICARLDRLPLAIELAAARIGVFPPAELLDRLERRLPLLVGGARDLPARQRTLRRTLEWSFELLGAAEADAFERLAVFHGGWTLAGANELDVADDALEGLVESSLVQRVDGRFAMLETIREFAAERLERRADAQALRRRHAELVCAFAEGARGYARGPDAIEWLDRTQAELDNIRAALAWSTEHDSALGLTLAEALEPFWYRRGLLREGLRWLEPLLELGSDAPIGTQAGALGVAGRLASELGSADRARPWYEQSLRLSRRAGDREREAWALHGLGYVSALEGDRGTARELLEQSLELFLELGQHAPAGGRLTYLAELAYQDGDLAATRSHYQRAIEEYSLAGDTAGVVGSTEGLAAVAFEEEDFPRVLEILTRALEHPSEDRDLAYYLAGIAAVAARMGNRAGAHRLWGAVQRIDAEVGATAISAARPRYAEAVGEPVAAELARGAELTTDEAIALARELALLERA